MFTMFVFYVCGSGTDKCSFQQYFIKTTRLEWWIKTLCSGRVICKTRNLSRGIIVAERASSRALESLKFILESR